MDAATEQPLTRDDQQLLDQLFEFVDQSGLSEEALLEELEKRFPRHIIDAFTAAMTGTTPVA